MVALRHGVRVALRERHPAGRRPEVVLEPVDLPLGNHEPTRPRDATGDAIELWRYIADHARHPATRARFLDLLVVRGGPGTPGTAAAAMRAYLDVAKLGPYRLPVATSPDPADLDTSSTAPHPAASAAPEGDTTADPDDSERAASTAKADTTQFLNFEWRGRSVDLAIGRALTLARIATHDPNGPPAARAAVDLALDLATTRLTSPVTSATAVALLEFASAHPDPDPAARDRLVHLAEQASIALVGRPWLIDALGVLLSGINPTRRAEMDERRIAARVTAANGKPPAARLLLLDEAAALATRLHRPDLADPITRQMQTLDKTQLGLMSIQQRVNIPAEVLDTAIEQMSHGPDWRTALASWLDSGSPTGDPAVTEETVRLTRDASGLARFLPTVLLGADQLPRWRAQGESDEESWNRARVEERHIRVQGFVVAEALDQVAAKGPPDQDELTVHLGHLGAGDPHLTAALSRAFGHYWDGDYEAVVHTAAPRVEAAARALALELDLAAYQVARANEPGKYVGLGVLLSILEKVGLDPAWERFLRTFLTGPLGINVRNNVAHGFVLQPPSRETAALSLRALSMLTLLVAPDPTMTQPARSSTEMPLPGTIAQAAAVFLGVAVTRPHRIPALLAGEARSAYRILQALRPRPTARAAQPGK